MTRAAATAPARITWAVDLLDVTPADQILEFGCGPGVAVALVGGRLRGGRITAIDRSATAIERTRARNAALVEAGHASLHPVDLAAFQSEPQQFDKAFAVNVNVFWTGDAAAECAVLHRVLKPAGLLLLVYDGPAPDGARDVAPRIIANLHRHAFATDVTNHPAGMLAITARPATSR